eukprot:1182726-Prorocentrum_minimum.AAC.1
MRQGSVSNPPLRAGNPRVIWPPPAGRNPPLRAGNPRVIGSVSNPLLRAGNPRVIWPPPAGPRASQITRVTPCGNRIPHIRGRSLVRRSVSGNPTDTLRKPHRLRTPVHASGVGHSFRIGEPWHRVTVPHHPRRPPVCVVRMLPRAGVPWLFRARGWGTLAIPRTWLGYPGYSAHLLERGW